MQFNPITKIVIITDKTSSILNKEKQSLTEVFEGKNLLYEILSSNRPEGDQKKQIIAICGKKKILDIIVTKRNFGSGISQIANFIKEGEVKGYIELADSYSITK